MATARWLAVIVVLSLGVSVHAAERQRLLLDSNWRFTLDDPSDAGGQFAYREAQNLSKASPADLANEPALATQRTDAAAANLGSAVSYVQSSFDDSKWRQLDLPHDWVVELPFDQGGDNNHGSKKIGPRLGNTIGWYRRKFDLSAEDKGKSLWVEFDGVYRNSLVWLNGHCLGRNPSGYSSFWYDIAKFANFGGSNEMVVRVDATRTEGWFYEGAGIYRHVWLVKTAPVHVAHWGTYVTSEVWGQNATVTARATVRNDSDQSAGCEVVQTLLDATGKTIAEGSKRLPVGTEAIAPNDQRDVDLNLQIYNAHLWSLDDTYMYTLVTTIRDDTGVLDTYTTPFGIRTLRFDSDLGFFLNGKHVEVQGTCNHQDHAGVGSALPDAIQYFRIGKLKEMGSNALRTSHNDPTPELLDACDKLGMLVMDEHRYFSNGADNLALLAGQVERDRNHPSVFMWSIGNEEPTQSTALGQTIATEMQRVVHQLDPTRPCTEAMNGGWGRGLSNVIDVQGYNYFGGGSVDNIHKQFPRTPSIGTEESSALSTRGEYANDRGHSFEAAYDTNAPRWGSTAEKFWNFYAARPFIAGAFVWTGFDYRGEPTPYRWPAISSQFGILDTCGFPKDNFYYYQSVWSSKPVLHLLPHWNWAGQEGKPIDVWCYSNFDAVELFLNGASLGKKPYPVNSHLEWSVPYAAGTLEARGYKGDQVAATTKVETTGAAAGLVLTPDRATISADGRDCSVVDVAVVDAQGRTVPTADNLVKFTLSGGGQIIGVGNGSPASHEPDKASQRSVFNGLCMAIVQSGKQAGAIQITATADGLAPATGTITTQEAAGTAEVQ